MPVTTTYPGIYIEELPSSSHTITAAATSVTVFVGYSHPFKTPSTNFNKPIELFSFTDYETNFGGFFQGDMFTDDELAGYFGDLAEAVNQFFLNGGTDAWVVGLQASPFIGGQPVPIGALTYYPGETLPTLGPLTFTAREITDANHVLTVTLSVPPPAGGSVSVSQPDTVVDLLITYGPPPRVVSSNQPVRAESYRQVSLYPPPIYNPNPLAVKQSNPNYILNRINGVSALVVVAPPAAASGMVSPGWVQSTGTTFAAASPSPPSPPGPRPAPLIFNVNDFIPVFQADTALDKLAIFNLLVLPGVSDFGTLTWAASFCERKLAFLIMDPPVYDSAGHVVSADGTVPLGSTKIQDIFNAGGVIPESQNAALYFPYLQSPDSQTGQTIYIPPSATVAGIFAATDTNRGVWKAPAGLATTLTNIIDVVPSGQMTDMRQGVLNTLGINCIRKFPAIEPVIWGARTSVAFNTAFAQWKYVPVRRMALFLEQTLYAALGWVVFEPNADPLWTSIRASIEAFMLGLYLQGAFQGTTPSQAFQVKCDDQTTTQADIDNGVVNIVVAFAPLKPAEFVIIQIAQLAGQTQTS